MPQKRVKVLNPDGSARTPQQEAAQKANFNQQLAQSDSPQTMSPEQKKAQDQGVSVQAFKKAGETNAQFQARVQSGNLTTPSLTAEQVNAEQQQRQQFETARNQNIQAQQNLTTQGIEQVFPNAVANAQNMPGIGTARTPQEALNPANTFGGAVRGATSLLIPAVSLGASAGANIGSLGGLAGGALSVFSIGKFFNAFTTGKQNEALQDMGNAVKSAKFAAKGAQEDPALALDIINQRESELVAAAGKLHVLYTQDPTKSIAMQDIEDSLAASLAQVQFYRDQVERARRTGDFLTLQAAIGNMQEDTSAT